MTPNSKITIRRLAGAYMKIAWVVGSLTFGMPASGSLGDSSSYVAKREADGGREIKAWIEVAPTGSYFLTIEVDAGGGVRKICADPYPIPRGALDSPSAPTDSIATWTIELLRRKGHGRTLAGFWMTPAGQRLAKEIATGKLPKPCE